MYSDKGCGVLVNRDLANGCCCHNDSGTERRCAISDDKAAERARTVGLYVGARTGLEE